MFNLSLKGMSDQEIINALINGDEEVTHRFFFITCRPLFQHIINYVFPWHVDYDEVVNELYYELMKDNARKLRNFEFRSTIFQWLKVVAIRHFIRKRDELIENRHENSLLEKNDVAVDETHQISARLDLEVLFACMSNKRYAYILKKLQIEGVAPKQLAEELCITVDNLYNIKRRAMVALAHIALKDVQKYGKNGSY